MESHLLQMRGLKLNLTTPKGKDGQVASFTDAWIETSVQIDVMNSILVASFTDAWIETFAAGNDPKKLSRIFYRCVD